VVGSVSFGFRARGAFAGLVSAAGAEESEVVAVAAFPFAGFRALVSDWETGVCFVSFVSGTVFVSSDSWVFLACLRAICDC